MIFSSKPENMILVERFMYAWKEAHGIETSRFSVILCCITEAITNAIRHGNRNDPKKSVRLECKERPGGEYVFSISDEGEGFNWRRFPNPLSPEACTQPGGRGLFLMEKLSNRLIFNEKGNKVEIVFKA